MIGGRNGDELWIGAFCLFCGLDKAKNIKYNLSVNLNRVFKICQQKEPINQRKESELNPMVFAPE